MVFGDTVQIAQFCGMHWYFMLFTAAGYDYVFAVVVFGWSLSARLLKK